MSRWAAFTLVLQLKGAVRVTLALQLKGAVRVTLALQLKGSAWIFLMGQAGPTNHRQILLSVAYQVYDASIIISLDLIQKHYLKTTATSISFHLIFATLSH